MAEVITLTAGADYYENRTTTVIIQALGGNDTVYNGSDANSVTISGDDGNDSLRSYASNGSINSGTGNDIIRVWYGDNNSLTGETGNDTLENFSGDNAWISGGDGTDSIDSDGANATIYGGNDNDNIDSDGHYAYINGEAGNDVIDSDGTNCTIFGGDGSDLIYVSSSSHNTSVSAGTGDDTVRVYGGSNISINGGAGNDSIDLSNYGNSGNVVQYSGYGADTVTGFGVNDTLQVAGSYSSQISGNDIMFYVGAGSVLLEKAASLSSSLNIQTVPAGSFGDTTSTIPVTMPSPGTNQVLSNYTGEPVTVSGFTGATFSGNNFVVNSSAGTLTIQNVTDKIVDLRNASGGEFLKAYQASSAGVVDGRGISAYEIIEGSAAGTDVILAGDGGSQLWGGSGSASDAIAGGNGSDIFIGGRYQGSDNFYNVSSADAINLTDATLSDIVGTLEVNGNTIAIGFNTGAIITAQSTDTLSAAINLADGTSWRFNHVTKSWQGA